MAELKTQEKNPVALKSSQPCGQVPLYLCDTGRPHLVCFIQNTKLLTMKLGLQPSLLDSFHDTPERNGRWKRPLTFLFVCLYLYPKPTVDYNYIKTLPMSTSSSDGCQRQQSNSYLLLWTMVRREGVTVDEIAMGSFHF